MLIYTIELCINAINRIHYSLKHLWLLLTHIFFSGYMFCHFIRRVEKILNIISGIKTPEREIWATNEVFSQFLWNSFINSFCCWIKYLHLVHNSSVPNRRHFIFSLIWRLNYMKTKFIFANLFIQIVLWLKHYNALHLFESLIQSNDFRSIFSTVSGNWREIFETISDRIAHKCCVFFGTESFNFVLVLTFLIGFTEIALNESFEYCLQWKDISILWKSYIKINWLLIPGIELWFDYSFDILSTFEWKFN